MTDITLKGTVTDEAGVSLPGAQIRANNESAGTTLVRTVDDNGAYSLDNISSGQWTISAILDGYRTPRPTTGFFEQNKDDLDFQLAPAVIVEGTFRRYGSAQERIPCGVVVATAADQQTGYAEANSDGHYRFSGLTPDTWTFIGMEENSKSLKLERTLQPNNNITDLDFNLARTQGNADAKAGQRFFLGLIIGLGVLVVVYLLLHWALPQPEGTERFSLWAQEPWQYVEVLLWGLAGVLVQQLIVTGTYLRWNSFYREGIWMNVAHIIAAPLLVFVTVLLLSLAKLTLEMKGESSLVLDLSDPRIMVAVAFLLGSSPWNVWDFVQSAAERVTDVAGNEKPT